MKTSILFMLLLVSFNSFSQEQTRPFEKANTIIIYHYLDTETAFDEMYKLLVENGYFVIEANDRFHFLVTEEVYKGSRSLAIKARVDKNKVILGGTYGFNKATFRPSETNNDRIAFDKLNEIAKKFPEGSITYSMQ